MITDDERREVAARLRGLDYSDLQESLICAYLDALGIKGYEDWIGIAHRLADLIEPSEPKVKCVAEVWVVVSEPFDLPSEDEFNRDFITSVHGVFDSKHAAYEYSLYLQRNDRDRVYGAFKARTVGDKIEHNYSQL